MSLLTIKNLRVEFGAAARPFPAVDGVDLEVPFVLSPNWRY